MEEGKIFYYDSNFELQVLTPDSACVLDKYDEKDYPFIEDKYGEIYDFYTFLDSYAYISTGLYSDGGHPLLFSQDQTNEIYALCNIYISKDGTMRTKSGNTMEQISAVSAYDNVDDIEKLYATIDELSVKKNNPYLKQFKKEKQ